MKLEKNILIQHIESFAKSGEIHDDLLPFYDQDGKWCGGPWIWIRDKLIPYYELIKSSCLSSSRRTKRGRYGTVLRTSFIWRGDGKIDLNYTTIEGAFIVEGNASIHACNLRHVAGSFCSTTTKKVYLPNLVEVGRHYEMMHSFSVYAPRLRRVGGRLKTIGKIPPRLESTGESLALFWSFNAESKSLRHVGGYLILAKAEEVRFPKLESIGGRFLPSPLTLKIDAPRLAHIGGDFLASSAIKIITPALCYVGGSMDTMNAKYFYNPKIKVGGTWTTYPGAVEDWARRDAARRAMKQKQIWI